MQVKTIKCMYVVAQVTLGYYDAEGNLIGDETFPQNEGNVLTAKLFHPHAEHVTRLIEACVQQAWGKLNAQTPSPIAAPSMPTAALGDRKHE